MGHFFETGRESELDHRWSVLVLGTSVQTSRRLGIAVIVGSLAVCWAITAALGGATSVPPHYFYIPILFAGVRFGAASCAVTAVASGLLAGPLSAVVLVDHDPQPTSDWLVRLLFFVVIGQALTAMLALGARARRDDLADGRAAQDLWRALDDGRVQVHYQRIVCLQDGRIRGAEALLRVHDEDGSTIPPDQIIPAAERNGTIRPLGDHVLRTACATVAQWQSAGLLDEGFSLGVNVSPKQLESPDFTERVRRILDETGLDPTLLLFEVTETALASDRSQFVDSLHRLHRLGLRFAMDDFGTGHSTLAEVQSLPIDVLKIDRAFVSDLDGSGAAIAENVVALAAALGLSTIAEGIEDRDQAERLSGLGCVEAQGFLFGRPAPADDLELALMADRSTAAPPASGPEDRDSSAPSQAGAGLTASRGRAPS